MEIIEYTDVENKPACILICLMICVGNLSMLSLLVFAVCKAFGLL